MRREPDIITQTLAMWLLYAVLIVIGITQLPRVVEVVRDRLSQPMATTSKVRL